MQRKKKSKAKSPLIRLVGLEAAVVATGLVGSPVAVAAPGDLDPSFGDVGRQSGIAMPWYAGLWSVDLQPDDSVLLGGGGEYEYYGYYEFDFVERLLPTGVPDAGFAAGVLANTVVYDTTLQPDGKVVGVGTARQTDGRKKLLVFRLRPDGALDADFGLGGQVLISDGTASRESGYSVLVEPDGRIVVAGQRGDSLLVARLLANGAVDAGFGSAGVFVGPELNSGTSIRLAGALAGGYRIAAEFRGTPPYCAVAGLTAAGAPDALFGSGGFMTPQSSGGGSVHCFAMAVQTDGRIMVGGQDALGSGYVGRLLANGQTDPGFTAGVTPSRFGSVSALAVGTTGSIFVAGSDPTGFSGALIVRLLADGSLDPLFGRAGAAYVPLKSRRTAYVGVRDMKVDAGGRLVVGGNLLNSWEGGAFVARMLGDAPGGGPGVLGVKESRVLGTEQSGKVVLSVQRTGGSSGPVAVTYSTRDFPASPAAGSELSPGAPADAGADYTTTTGRLTWADGDVSDREIIVPLATDATAEAPEFFEVVLDSPEGSAGLATFGADLEIAGASYPYGDFTISAGSPTVNESAGQADFFVYRMHYGQGAVSVTVRVAASSVATPGQDFANPGSNTWQDVVLTWGVGEIGGKHLPVRIVNDTTVEGAEAFSLELVSPTGGATLGVVTQATVQINAEAAPLPPPKKLNGGGGSFGWLGALLFGLWGAFRRR